MMPILGVTAGAGAIFFALHCGGATERFISSKPALDALWRGDRLRKLQLGLSVTDLKPLPQFGGLKLAANRTPKCLTGNTDASLAASRLAG
ncbi:MAG TPA: hypothetical protein VHX61_02225 [Rhizomicrobium sp.]|nr:hypothetical protein [Rhizomicrobium sp.]